MPIYEFSCQKCSDHFEVLVSLGGEKTVSCPACKSKNVSKLFSSFGIGGGSNRVSSSSESCTSCTKTSCSTCN